MDGPHLLAAYLKENKLSLRGFAEKVDAPFALVWRWARAGEGRPGIEYALAIEDVTEGRVPVSSWAAPAKRLVRRSSGRSPGKTANRSR